ncbi:MAG: lytic transglycosylase domain-containing protein [Rhodoferax sp.]|nr:lytic transglycosylase domain-containing protein [Rhodoferax sp.]
MRWCGAFVRHWLGAFRLALACMLVLAGGLAHADVWGYIDGQGVAHLASERLDERYELFFKGDQGFDTRLGVAPLSDTPRAATLPEVPHKLLVFFDVSPNYRLIKQNLRDASRDHGVDYELLKAVIATESGFDTLAVSPKGAIGLMQIMPPTAERYGVQADRRSSVEKKLTDPKINIRTGTRYLRDLINLFAGQLDLALAAYNAGEGAVRKAGNRVPNFKETQDYVKTVMQLYAALKPPAGVGQPATTPSRVRMQLQGGARQRGNMPTPAPAISTDFK